MSKWSYQSRNSSEKISTWYVKKGQSNKKCSVFSIPSLIGHIGFIVSLKLFEFVKIQFTETHPKLGKIR